MIDICLGIIIFLFGIKSPPPLTISLFGYTPNSEVYSPVDGKSLVSEVSVKTLTVPSSPPSIYIDVPYL